MLQAGGETFSEGFYQGELMLIGELLDSLAYRGIIKR